MVDIDLLVLPKRFAAHGAGSLLTRQSSEELLLGKPVLNGYDAVVPLR